MKSGWESGVLWFSSLPGSIGFISLLSHLEILLALKIQLKTSGLLHGWMRGACSKLGSILQCHWMPLDIVAPHIFTKPIFFASGILGRLCEDLEADFLTRLVVIFQSKMNREFIHPLSNIAMEDFLPFENSSTGPWLSDDINWGDTSRYSQ